METTSFRWIRLLLIGFIWLGVFMVSAPLLIYTLPDIETKINPVLRNQKIDMVIEKTGGDFLLWRWTYDKVRRGTPEYFSFMAYSRSNPRERVPVEVFTDWNCTRHINSNRAAPLGVANIREMCARLPNFLKGKQDIVIDGYADYRVGHPFYSIPQRIPDDPEDWPGVGPIADTLGPTPVIGAK